VILAGEMVVFRAGGVFPQSCLGLCICFVTMAAMLSSSTGPHGARTETAKKGGHCAAKGYDGAVSGPETSGVSPTKRVKRLDG
jgi:hypothetical protein